MLAGGPAERGLHEVSAGDMPEPEAAPGGVPVEGGTLRFNRSIEPVSLDPVTIGDNGSGWLAIQVFDQLVEYLPGDKLPQPGLATKWDISGDGS